MHGIILRLFLALFIAGSMLLMVAPVQAEERYHEVQRGESLGLIAQQHNVDPQELMSLNGISDPNVIYIGQRLLLPLDASVGVYGSPAAEGQLPGSEGYYTVRQGDSLSEIALAHAMTLTDLMRLNGINNAGFVYVGQRLRVTARVTPALGELETQPQLAETIYVVQPGDTLYAIARAYETTAQELMIANGLPNINSVWIGQRVRIRPTPVRENTLLVAGAPADGRRWIEVNLTNQTLTAWQGDVAVLHTKITAGAKQWPTVTGRFKILRKYQSQTMSGPGYSIPNVPWVMYFHGGYAIHGAYWRTEFGEPGSHGCVNVRVDEAELLYNWAPMETEVYVHH